MIDESVITSGEIYFLCEIDVLSGEKSPYVKIGLVELLRESSNRKKEHQTGNPRDLFRVRHVKTDCVRAVEKYLHWHYIEYGVRGEWFKFDDETLSGAIKYAEELRDKFADQITSLSHGIRYQSVVSDGRVKPATDEAQRWLHEYNVAHLIKTESEKATQKFREAVKEAYASGVDVTDAGEVTGIQRRILDEKALKINEPDLYGKYLFEKIIARFKVTPAGAAAEYDPRVAKAAVRSSDLVQAVEAMKSKKLDFNAVSQIAFGVDSASKFYAKEKELAQLHLQAQCESAEKIDSICTWKREADSKFDLARFKKEQPEAHERYSSITSVITFNPDNTGQAD